MDRGAWRATVHGVAKGQAWLSSYHSPCPYTTLPCTKSSELGVPASPALSDPPPSAVLSSLLLALYRIPSFVCWVLVQQANGLWNPSSPLRDVTPALTTVLTGNYLSYSSKGNHFFFHVKKKKTLWIRDLGLQVTQQFCFHPWLVSVAAKCRCCLDSLPPLPRPAPSLPIRIQHSVVSLRHSSAVILTKSLPFKAVQWLLIYLRMKSKLLKMPCGPVQPPLPFFACPPLPCLPPPPAVNTHSEVPPHRTAWNSLEASHGL